MKILKILYYSSLIICLVELLFWSLGPFFGIGKIYSMIMHEGFYVNSSYQRNYTLAEMWGVGDNIFYLINRGVAIVYFSSIILVVLSFFFTRIIDKKKVYLSALILCLLSIFIWLIIPVVFF